MKRSLVTAVMAMLAVSATAGSGVMDYGGEEGCTEMFYAALRPHGRWMQTEEFGTVWQPDEARQNAAWRPYCDGGRWVRTPRGLSWCSIYAWGWAPFHYGRWILHGRWGWVWVPGTRWAPAWVDWRDCPGYLVWAPLPPPPPAWLEMRLRFHGGPGGCEWGFDLSERQYVCAPLDGDVRVGVGIAAGQPCGGGRPRHAPVDPGCGPPRPPCRETPGGPPPVHGSAGGRAQESVRIVRQVSGAGSARPAPAPQRGSAPEQVRQRPATGAASAAASGNGAESRAERGRQIVRERFRR
jgi:hypothetical protein